MKVIFLDIDGVLDSTRSCVAYGDFPCSNHKYEFFDDVAVCLIRRICKENDVKIVLSSSWKNYKGWEYLARTLNLPIIDKTPSKLSAIRGEEIAEYLRNHSEVEKYCIVDDDSDMLEEQLSNFVQTDNNEGLSYDNYKQILEVLK